MRDLITLVEAAQADDPIATLISRAKFRRVLDRSNYQPQLMVAVPASYVDPQDWRNLAVKPSESDSPSGYDWRHVFVKVGDRLYDIQGVRTEQQLKRKYRTAFLLPITAAALEGDINHLKRLEGDEAYERRRPHQIAASEPSFDRYQHWHDRLGDDS